MTTIRAIETRYAGCRFRSRLEARWAVFFDALRIEWQYEPEGFDLPSGWYLPDFLLTLGGGQAWFEVKSTTDIEDSRWGDLATSSRPLYVSGELPDPRMVTSSSIDNHRMEAMPVTWGGQGFPQDFGHVFCVCPHCAAVGIQFEGRSNRIGCCAQALRENDDLHHSANHPRILGAYRAARSARFEHGENARRR